MWIITQSEVYNNKHFGERDKGTKKHKIEYK